MLNNLVDRVFVITTVDSDRYAYVKDHYTQQGINYQLVIAPNYKIITNDIKVMDSGDDTRPSISLLSAYQSIIKTSILLNLSRIAILEDDCFFIPTWKLLMEKFINNIPHDWDVVNVGYHPSHDTYAIKENFNEYAYIPLDRHYTTHCVLYNSDVFQDMFNLFNQLNYSLPIDYMLNVIYTSKKYKAFYPRDHIVYQLSTRKTHKYDIPYATVRFNSYVNADT